MAPRTAHPPVHPARQVIGWLLLAAGIAASLALAAHSLSGRPLIGCGPANGCQAALSSRWSQIGGWPVSYLALCYFGGAGAAWLVARRYGIGAFLHWMVRLGAVASVTYVAVGWSIQANCHYCLAVHAVNLSFWLLVETAPRALEISRSAMAFVGGFAVLFAALTVTESENRWRHTAESDALDGPYADAREGSDAIDGADRSAAGTRSRSGGSRAQAADGNNPVAATVTVYTDYCCLVCREVDETLAEIAATNPGVELVIKHYPLCTDCNPNAGVNTHPNACRAARAAEAAEMEADPEGFRRMHAWLFDRAGEFTDEQLRGALPGLGISNVEAFLATMNSGETLRRIQFDVQEGAGFGVEGTPSLFVNSYRLRNWREGSLEAAVLQLARRTAPRSTLVPGEKVDADTKEPDPERAAE